MKRKTIRHPPSVLNNSVLTRSIFVTHTRYIVVVVHTVTTTGKYKVVLLFFYAFAKLRKATISLVMSVCPSVRMEQLDFHWTDYNEI
jgi:hypothetical protein